MADKPFTWPNSARVAFVLGIAFEAWDRKKPTAATMIEVKTVQIVQTVLTASTF